LFHHLDRINYDKSETQYLINGFTYGFKLGHEGPVSDSEPSNDISVDNLPEITLQKIQKEIVAGRLAGPFDHPPFTPFHCSPIKLVEKSKKNTYRLIHNLSWPYDSTSINSSISSDHKTVKYSSVSQAIRCIMKFPKGAYTWKTDLEHAFKLIPIHPQDYHKLGFKFKGKYYYDKTLPQGAGSACRIFERFSTSINAIHVYDTEPDSATHYLDDFFFICLTLLLALKHRELFDSLCEDIGIPQAPDKRTEPCHVTQYLGLHVDSENWLVTLPTEKLEPYLVEVQESLQHSKLTQLQMQSLVGKLSFASSVVPARPFLRRLIDKIYTVKKPHHLIRLTSSMKEDLETWQQFLKNYNGVTYFRMLTILPLDHLEMASDASILGFGAIFKSHWMQARYPPAWKQLYHEKKIGSSFIELYPIYVLICMFGQRLTNLSVLHSTDNEGLVPIINKQSSSSKFIMKIIRPLVLKLIQYNISLYAKHVPGKAHILCDRISRFQETPQLLLEHNMNPQRLEIPTDLNPTNFNLQ